MVFKVVNIFFVKYMEGSAAEQVGVDCHGDRNNAWCQCQRRRRDAGPGLPGREPFSSDTSGSRRPLGAGRPNNR